MSQSGGTWASISIRHSSPRVEMYGHIFGLLSDLDLLPWGIPGSLVAVILIVVVVLLTFPSLFRENVRLILYISKQDVVLVSLVSCGCMRSAFIEAEHDGVTGDGGPKSSLRPTHSVSLLLLVAPFPHRHLLPLHSCSSYGESTPWCEFIPQGKLANSWSWIYQQLCQLGPQISRRCPRQTRTDDEMLAGAVCPFPWKCFGSVWIQIQVSGDVALKTHRRGPKSRTETANAPAPLPTVTRLRSELPASLGDELAPLDVNPNQCVDE